MKLGQSVCLETPNRLIPNILTLTNDPKLAGISNFEFFLAKLDINQFVSTRETLWGQFHCSRTNSLTVIENKR